MNYIYALIDPRDSRIRYIGKSTNPKKRLGVHLRDSGNCHRVAWIQSLLKVGMVPQLAIMEEVAADADWQERERFWIQMHRSAGCDLTNGTDGGDGGDTGNGLPERRRINSESLKGRVFTEEHRRRLSEAGRGRRLSEASLAKMAEAKRGHTLTEEHRRKIGLAGKGKPQSPLQKQRLMEANTGRLLTSEHRQKISDAHRHLPPETKTRVSEAVAASNRRRAEAARSAKAVL